MKISNEYVEHEIDIVQHIEELQEKHRTVYWTHIFNNLYVYKPLGRKDFRDIVENDQLNIAEKEDEICRKCLLYPNPKDMDFDNIEAGIVQKLYKVILKNSHLDSVEARTNVLEYFREEMFDFQNQIPCLINEAFPNFDIEEIENWDVERTAKYLSRAEFKLQNYRGFEFNYDYLNSGQEPVNEQPQQDPNMRSQEAPMETTNNKGREALTPQKLAELKAKFPEIDWEGDTVLNEGINGMKDSVDTLAPALRVGW